MPLKIYSYEEYKKTRVSLTLESLESEREQVAAIISAVRREGDLALRRFARQFDGAVLGDLKVGEEEIAAARRRVDPALQVAMEGAAENIEQFHRRQLREDWWSAEPGRLLGQVSRPLASAGAYVPGGTAAYPSSVLMTVIPARVAGVPEIIVCTPPGGDGGINPATLAAASLAGATAVYKVGGAQAIAAMAFGTETVPAVRKIVGPGNIYVTLAKKELFGRVGIDMLAGPSEIVIVAGEEANPAYIAADLLSQAEHDPLSRSILVTPGEALGHLVKKHLHGQLALLPRRSVAEQALKNGGAIILVPSLEEAWPVVNDLAPEHLELHLEDPRRYLERVTCAGAVFLGPHTPESLGDYWAGPNHVLPTAAAARYASPLGVYDFIKYTNVLSYDRAALGRAAPHLVALARAEGFEAHARAVLIRGDEDEAPIED